jgi:hypothetical protein
MWELLSSCVARTRRGITKYALRPQGAARPARPWFDPDAVDALCVCRVAGRPEVRAYVQDCGCRSCYAVLGTESAT